MIPITYEEAAKELNMNANALRNAASRGVLTRLPRTGMLQPLIKEQVLLFKGKRRLSLHALSVQEKADWARYAQADNESEVPQGENPTPPEMEVTTTTMRGSPAQIAAYQRSMQAI